MTSASETKYHKIKSKIIAQTRILLKIIMAPDISYQYERNFIRWYFQP